ncbi:MAG: hypothetical protein QUV71_14535 [Rhizobium sp.]|nr:hypothetical protein [Rhizobium sp.]MDM8014219.1 hypothetical protein [Rhizobium sp.]
MASAETLFAAFQTDNARNETDEKIVNSVVPTDVFWSLFSAGHTIIYGSRGSGKTLVSRLASYPLLSQSSDTRAHEIIEAREFIGVFVNTDLRFVGSTRSPIWTHSEFSDTHFVWKFNLNCLKSVCTTLDSLLATNFGDTPERFVVEQRLANEVAASIGLKATPRLRELPAEIAKYESAKRASISVAYLNGQEVRQFLADIHSTELLESIQRLFDTFVQLCPRYAGVKWLFFIDEAEFLTPAQLRILNSFMRTHSGGVFLKIATLPYHYSTFETNIGVSLQEGDDFGVEFLDASPIYTLNSDNARPIYDFARNVFANRIRQLQDLGRIPSDETITARLSSLDQVLGGSRLIGKKPRDADISLALARVRPHLDVATMQRAEKLSVSPGAFDDQIWRKVAGPISLREEFQQKRAGRHAMEAFSGVEIVVRCTDGVPRRMINIFQLIAREAARSLVRNRKNQFTRKRTVLSYRAQNRILISFGASRHANSLAVPHQGPAINQMILEVGRYFHQKLHSKDGLASDLIMSFDLDDRSPELMWKTVQLAIAYGHIVPNVTSSRAKLSGKRGTYRLSFAYSPYFQLYPTQGRSHSLSRILSAVEKKEFPIVSTDAIINAEQMELFLDATPS